MTFEAAPRLHPADTGVLHALEEACMRFYAEALWGADLGCLAVEDRPDHLWIDEFYVAPGAQNRGLGAWIPAVARAEAREGGAPPRLSALRTHPALRYGLRHGFRVVERTPERRLSTDAPA